MSVFKAIGISGSRRLGHAAWQLYYGANRDLPLSRRIYRLDGGIAIRGQYRERENISMRLIQSLSATTMTLAALVAMPVLAVAQDGPTQLAQAAAPAGPPTSGWTAPGAAPQAAPPPPPSSGWSAPGAAPAPMAAPRRPSPSAAGLLRARSAIAAVNSCRFAKKPKRKPAPSRPLPPAKKQPVVCAAFRNFATAEAKVVKYAEEHGDECRIPPDAIKMMKANHAKTLEIRTKVCDVAAAPQPRAPSLSDAL